MTDKHLLSMNDMTQSISIDPSALLTTSTINALHFPDLTTSGISDSGGGAGKGINLNLEGVGMCDSIMTESFCEASGHDDVNLVNTHANGLHNDNSMTNSSKNLNKKDSNAAQKKRRSRKAQYDAVVDGASLDKIDIVNFHDELNEADDAWLYQLPGSEKKNNSDNIISWVHKEFKENDINATKHRLLCKLDDMSNARTIRSVSCHNFAGNQRSDSVKRSATEQQVHPGITLEETRLLVQSTDLLENALYLTEYLNLHKLPTNKFQSSTISLDSIEKDRDLFFYDSLNDDESDTNADEFFDCSNDTNLLQTIANERRYIEQLTRRCSSLDSLENFDSKPLSSNGRLTSPIRSTTPVYSRTNSDTRPTSPAGTSPLRHTVALGGGIRSRDGSRDREREPLDYTDLEVMAKVQLENLRQAEKQGPLSKRFGGSNASLASNHSATSLNLTNQPQGTKPPVVPKSSAITRNGVKPNNHRRSNTQTITTNLGQSYDLPDATEIKPATPITTTNTTRTSIVPANSTNTNRTRPPVSRPLQPYRGSQTAYNNAPKTMQAAVAASTPPAMYQKVPRKSTNDLGSTFTAKQFTSTENNLLNDVSNKPLTTPVRSQIGVQRRTPTQSSVEQIPPSNSIGDMSTTQTSIPRSSSTLSQGRRSGIPTIGKQTPRTSIPTATRHHSLSSRRTTINGF